MKKLVKGYSAANGFGPSSWEKLYIEDGDGNTYEYRKRQYSDDMPESGWTRCESIPERYEDKRITFIGNYHAEIPTETVK